MNNSEIINVFQPGLVRGEEVSAYAKKIGYGVKKYFYVESPTEGWRVFIRACCFIHIKGKDFEPTKFVVVKTTDANPKTQSWEPPKGQTEGKDALKNPKDSLLKILKENIKREVFEEAKIDSNSLESINHTGLVLQSVEKEYPDNTYFQYHIFNAFINESEFDKAKATFDWYKEHPKAWNRLRIDKREKDDIALFDPAKTKMMGRWSPSIVALYLHNIK
jgi:8-oxo-dGTP pyrophosphatase MutT (NUDIX family)